jgi:plastocyanin
VATAPSPQAATTVNISSERRFEPEQLSIASGQVVMWRNASRNPHTVTCDQRLVTDKSRVALPPGAQPFDSGVINPGATFLHRFDVSGDYQYVSLPFESQNVVGRVRVQG